MKAKKWQPTRFSTSAKEKKTTTTTTKIRFPQQNDYFTIHKLYFREFLYWEIWTWDEVGQAMCTTRSRDINPKSVSLPVAISLVN